mmetsp:Transcript_8186/g.17869  ORF Transcript_8186/g.17869 Transcript_8186/m.17869 type:complete len:224 (-) Transcript_8186:353-1024(-)
MCTKHLSHSSKFSILCCSMMPQSWVSFSGVLSGITNSTSTRKRGPKWYALTTSTTATGSCVSAISRILSRNAGSADLPTNISTCSNAVCSQDQMIQMEMMMAPIGSANHQPSRKWASKQAIRAAEFDMTSFLLSMAMASKDTLSSLLILLQTSHKPALRATTNNNNAAVDGDISTVGWPSESSFEKYCHSSCPELLTTRTDPKLINIAHMITPIGSTREKPAG